MQQIDLLPTLAGLAKHRPVFHSEADFQHAFAWQLHRDHPEAEVRLEYRPFLDESVYADMWAVIDGRKMAVEFKHLTKALEVVVGNERFVLRNQGAHDISAYDCLKDLARLERFVDGPADLGWLVVLSNDPLYWSPPARPGAGYDAFRLNDGRRVTGMLDWGPSIGAGTRRGRETPISIAGSYTLEWVDYSAVGAGPARRFRYLAVEVDKNVSRATT